MNQEIIYKIKYSSCHVKKFLLDILKKKSNKQPRYNSLDIFVILTFSFLNETKNH